MNGARALIVVRVLYVVGVPNGVVVRGKSRRCKLSTGTMGSATAGAASRIRLPQSCLGPSQLQSNSALRAIDASTSQGGTPIATEPSTHTHTAHKHRYVKQ